MYYIKRMAFFTDVNTVSEVGFEPGLNIIYGESNTGKSMILDGIDYMFGASEHRFDSKINLTRILLELDVDGKKLIMQRAIDAKNFDVVSELEDIESGTYKKGSGDKSIGGIWLKLMGITEQTDILRTVYGKTQKLTLRTFSHMMLLDETRLQGTSSILSSGKGVNPRVDTPVLTALLYFATKKNYLPDKSCLDPTIRKAKSEAVKSFVDRSMGALKNKRISELNSFSQETPAQLQRKIDDLINEIGAAEGALDEALKRTAECAERITEIDEEMTNCRVLKNRNNYLLSQYEADIRRLTFIVEGDIHAEDIPKLDKCPFCNGELSKEKNESCLEAAIAEVEKIELQVGDLKSVQLSITQEISMFIEERKKVVEERKLIDERIRGELRPQIAKLKGLLSDYTIALGQYKAKEMIDAFSDVLINELDDVVMENSEDFHFELKRTVEKVFKSELEKELFQILSDCNYHDLDEVVFDMDSYDIKVNGHVKRSQGKGFRAFLNTIVAIAIQNCLEKKGEIVPQLLVVDSPILSLKEKEDHDINGNASESMKAGLFSYLISHQNNRQTIIIENILPPLDYSNVHLEEFTKDEKRGRYGLIKNYRE